MMGSARWLVLAAAVLGACAIDLLAHRGERRDPPRRAVAWSAAWIGLGLTFCAWLAVRSGRGDAEQFLAAYLVEKALSLDNLLVFFLIFGAFDIDPVDRRRVLFWGIVGALVGRGLFIAAGLGAIHRWRFVMLGFGAFLVYLSVRAVAAREKDEGPPRFVGWLQRHASLAAGVRRGFVVREGGRLRATPLAFALLAVESSDVLFAVDSIPTAFAITTSPFLLYASNVLAVLGLRALFLVLTTYLARMRTLRWGMAALLLLAGFKLLASPWVQVPTAATLATVVLCLLFTFVAQWALRPTGARP